MAAERLTLSSDLSELHRVFAFVEDFCAREGVTREVQMRICLVAEELIANVVEHGYGGRPDGQVEVSLSPRDALVELRVTDSAPPFDPLGRDEDLDVTSDLAERSIGGLGIALVKHHVLGADYRYSEGRNVMALTFGKA